MKVNVKRICFIFLCAMMVFGCSNSKSYERDTSSGEIIDITLEEMVEKMENKETFSVMFTQTTCGYCQDFEEVLTKYQENHHVVMYQVILDQEKASPKENLAIIKPYFESFSTTPGIFYVENGKNKSQLTEKNDTIDEQNLDEWVQSNQLDKK